MCPGARQSQVSYWLNQVEISSSLEGNGLTPARRVSFKTRVRPGPKQAEHKHDIDTQPQLLKFYLNFILDS